jgi:group I intron endonuclease
MEKEMIYKITSPIGKVYIGRTNNFSDRLAQHKHCALTKKQKNSLYKAIRKYGWDNMTKEIICEVDSKDAQRIEEELILAYNSVRKGYNDTFIGGGGDIWKDRRDTNEYMEFVDKMKRINKGHGNGMYGKLHKNSTTNLMKEKAKGRYSLDWFKARYGDSDGEIKYEERKLWLRNRNLKKDELGRFIKAK